MNYKLNHSLAICICAFISCLIPSGICASVKVDGIYYDLNTSAKTAAVAPNPDFYTGAVDIPSTFDYNGVTYKVTSIGSTAFLDCEGMTAINMPSSVTTIAPSAFERCAGLTNLEIGGGVTTINYEAFKNCINLSRLTLPSSLKTIGNESFAGCSSLNEIIAERTTVPTISSSTFTGVDKSTCFVYVPEGCKTKYESAANWKAFSNIVERTVVATGSCGDNVTYTIYSDMTMIISGTGAMTDYDFDFDNDLPVRINEEYYNLIKRVTIKEGVTSVGEFAFSNCTGLSSILIPSSVSKIGGMAFYGCTALTSIVVPSSVSEIGACAFSYSGLTHLYFDDSDDEILIELCDGDDMTTFSDCPLEYVYIGRNISHGDYPLMWDWFYPVPFSNCEIGRVEIGNCVTRIGTCAFRYSIITDFILSGSVRQIDSYAFRCCKVNNLYVGATPATIFANTFGYDHNDYYDELYGSDDYDIYSSCVLHVPDGCEENYRSARYWNLFQNIVEDSDDLDILATGYCGDNVTYTIYPDMTMVLSGTGAMWGCNSEGEIADPWYDHNDDNQLFYDYAQSIKKVIIEEGVTTIGYAAFSGCTSLTSVSMSNSVSLIGNSAFCECTSLSSITIPNTTRDIQPLAFYGCTNLVSIEIPGSVTNIGYAAFCGCSGLTELTILNGVEYIGSDAFDGCTGLTSLTIPSSVTGIDFGDWSDEYSVGAFSGCTGLVTITVDANNKTYDSRNNCNAIIETSTNTLIVGCKNTVIPNSVSRIGNCAFDGCTGLTLITIPNSVTEIASDAFRGCKGLTSLNIPSSVESICVSFNWRFENPECSFLGCTNLTSISVDADNNTYDSRNNCNAIIETSTNTLIYGCQNTFIPNTISSIGDCAFWDCTGLTSITIPSSVSTIGYSVFNCPNLSSIYVEGKIPASIYSDSGYGTFSFVDKNACTLYVPKGSKSAYKNTEGWNLFQNIVEVEFNNDTDIFALDNAIYVDQTDGHIGGTMDIPVKIKNSYAIRGFQFTLELPEGAIINNWALSKNRLPSGATLSDKIATQKIEGNKISVACSLNYGDATFTGNDGEIATVNVTFSEDMEVGTYPIYLTACDVTTASGLDEDLSDVKATLVLEDYLVGDANGDGKIRIGDATTILNYIVGTTSDNFNEKAADANGDGKIRIGDATTVLNIIVNQ